MDFWMSRALKRMETRGDGRAGVQLRGVAGRCAAGVRVVRVPLAPQWHFALERPLLGGETRVLPGFSWP